MTKPPLVYIIILNHNGKNHLEYCLPSVLATEYQNYRIVLLDNGSTDGSVEYTRENFSQVTVVQNDQNLGWAGGNNVGICHALDHGADYIVLQNNDTKVDSRWLDGAVQVCEANPRIGIVGFRMLQEYIQGEDPDEERFKELSAAWEKLEYEPADHVTGAALFVRADVFRDVGLIDEAYFAYSEEDDLEKRAVRAGYQMVRINVPLWHYNGGFWRKQFLKSSVMALRNNIRCMIKNDTLGSIWRQTVWLFKFVCPPRLEYDIRIPHFRRLRPSNFAVNNAILLYALVWNLLFLPATLWARYRDGRRTAQARKRWKRLPEA
ncbi:MAG: glycosyltransferase family 2 protein [Chloroflexota bacterium]|nr:glycosyltransferase family 2 protein [Chloroflexota bacterium]